MALLEQDDDKLLGADGQAAPGAGGGGQPQLGGSSGPATVSATPATGVSTAGVGAGGQGGWTNIQAYLGANKDNTSSSKLVDDVGSKFDSERSKLNDQSSEAKSKAYGEAEKTNIGQDRASQLIEQASAGGRGSDPYNQATGQLKSAVTAQYGGPSNFTFARDAGNTDYGSKLGGSDSDFGGFMQNQYKAATGGRITNGQMNLQKQFDTQGPAADALQSARQSALSKYAGLNTDFNTIVPQTDAAVKADQARFGTQQAGLSSYLTGTQKSKEGEIQGAADSWNAQNDAVQNAKPVGLYDKYLGYYDGSHGGTQKISSEPYEQFAAGEKGDLDSAQGVNTQKNVWNTISDVLNQNRQLGTDQRDLRKAQWNFDEAGQQKTVADERKRLAASGNQVGNLTYEQLVDAQNWLSNEQIKSAGMQSGKLPGAIVTRTSSGML